MSKINYVDLNNVSFPIKISTNLDNFCFDVTNEEDWKAISEAIIYLKNKWKERKNE